MCCLFYNLVHAISGLFVLLCIHYSPSVFVIKAEIYNLIFLRVTTVTIVNIQLDN